MGRPWLSTCCSSGGGEVLRPAQQWRVLAYHAHVSSSLTCSAQSSCLPSGGSEKKINDFARSVGSGRPEWTMGVGVPKDTPLPEPALHSKESSVIRA